MKIWLRGRVRCIRVTPHEGSLMRESLLIKDVGFVLVEHHGIVSPEHRAAAELIILIVFKLEWIFNLMAVLVVNFSIGGSCSFNFSQICVGASSLVIVIFKRNNLKFIKIHAIFTLGNTVGYF